MIEGYEVVSVVDSVNHSDIVAIVYSAKDDDDYIYIGVESESSTDGNYMRCLVTHEQALDFALGIVARCMDFRKVRGERSNRGKS